MSRRPWRDEAAVWLAPSQVGLALRRRGWRTRTERHGQAVAPGADALQALAQLAAVATPAAARTRIVVSNRFIHTALLPDGRGLRGVGERHLAARELLRGIHGDAVDRWQVAVDGTAAQGMPIAALDAGWLQRLQQQAHQAGLRPHSVRPLLALAAERAWPRIGARAAWLLVTEPDGAMLARLDAGWQSLRSLPLDPAAGVEAVPPWLARCALLDGLAPAALPLFHVAMQAAPQLDAALAQAGWVPQTLALDDTP